MPKNLPRYATLWAASFAVGILLTLVPSLGTHLNKHRWGVLLALAGASAVVALDVATEEG